ncbi:MAG TPA: hypothetical protein DCZ94_13435 [Lentisphaeria bacterium]|nr:MAG: hypothetical protein A2X48_01120 [Lentisphaerae bacterium GWF2_49_21]HBC87949.1 hypothetical protein [Lentisphaeria bacterium]
MKISELIASLPFKERRSPDRLFLLPTWPVLRSLGEVGRSALLSIISLSLLAIPFISFAEDDNPGAKLEPAEFLKIARRPPLEESWAKMNGEISHKRANTDTVKFPIYLGIRFTPERTLAQVVANKNEFYLIGQAYSDKPESTSVIVDRPDKDKSVLADCGIRPEDLALSFMFWPLQKELKTEDIKGYACRVFQLQSPDKKESATVYICIQYFFPLKVIWNKEVTGKEQPEIIRTLEVKSFKKEENFWIVNTLDISGPGWRTKIDFSEVAAGYSKNGVPQDIFQKAPEKK